MKTLIEKVNNTTCIHKITIMTHQFVDLESMERCVSCYGENKYCSKYKPVQNTGVRYSYLNLYKNKI